ncbi:MAG: class I SAM-dependent methyltransferase [Candidatus Nanoarchaeia archaeon]
MKNEKNKKRFDDLAEDYDLDALAFPDQDRLQSIVGDKVRDYYREIGERTLRILEIGSGTGITSKEIISATGNIELLMLDESQVMIAQARKNLASLLPRVKSKEFIEAEIGDYFSSRKYLARQEKNRFDMIISAQTLHNIERNERLEILKGIYANLKKRGIFVNADIIYGNTSPQRKDQFFYMVRCTDKYLELGRLDLKRKWRHHVKEDFSPKRIIIEKEFYSDLEHVGFNYRGIAWTHFTSSDVPYKVYTARKSV